MSEMIERVIKAIGTWEVVPDTDRQGRTWWHVCEASTRSGERYRDYVKAKVLRDQLNAIAVIKAMHEPTAEMVAALSPPLSPEAARACWRCAINAALEP